MVREQWDHPYKDGSSLFRFHISVANIVQSVHDAGSELNTIINVMKLEKVNWTHVMGVICGVSTSVTCKTRNAEWNGIWNGIWNDCMDHFCACVGSDL